MLIRLTCNLSALFVQQLTTFQPTQSVARVSRRQLSYLLRLILFRAGGGVNQEYSTTLYLRQVWRDERLSFAGLDQDHGGRSVTLHHRQFDRMWTPDVFIRNLKNGLFHTITVPNRLWTPDVFIRNLKNGLFHTITVPNRLIRLSPDGTILYSQRLTLTLSCDMILNKYPMDNQTCKIELGSCESSPIIAFVVVVVAFISVHVSVKVAR